LSGSPSTGVGQLFLLLANLVLVPLMALSWLVVYLGSPLILKYGEATTAAYVSSGIGSGGRRGGPSHWAVLRYGDVSGGTYEFDYGVDVPRLHEIEARRRVPIHYLPGWPSTAVVDESFDPIRYAIAWITTAVMGGILCVRWRRWRREPR
jgi:hypothetical protein